MAVDMFIKIGDIKGESVDHAHKDEIDVLSWSWGMSQQGSSHHGGGGGTGKVNVQDLSFTKFLDKASPNIYKFCCNGKHYSEATLTVRKAGEKPVEYMIVKLTDVLITSVSTGGSGGDDKITENVTLNFGKVKVSYQPQKKDGSKDGGPVDMGWDISANTELK